MNFFNLRKIFFSSTVLISCLLPSCASPLNTGPVLDQSINSNSPENNERQNESDNFEIKRVKKPKPTATATATPKPSISPTPTPKPSISPTPTPTPVPSPVPTNSGYRVISWSGYDWWVRNNTQVEGPGPNLFSNSTDNVFVDQEGQLHLKIVNRDNKWYCGEVNTLKSLGYGKYKFYLASRVDQLPDNVVLGLFIYDSDPAYNHREIDIEFSRWGDTQIANSQYVVQPYQVAQNLNRFESTLSGDYTTQSFDWSTNKIYFESLYGHYSTAPSSDFVINSWNYTGQDIPLKGNEILALNLWNYEGKAPPREVEVIIKKFEFTPITDIYVSN